MGTPKGRKKIDLAKGSPRHHPAEGLSDGGDASPPASPVVAVDDSSPRTGDDSTGLVLPPKPHGKEVGRLSPRMKRKVALATGSPRPPPEAPIQRDSDDHDVDAFASPGAHAVDATTTRRNDASPTDDVSELQSVRQEEEAQLIVEAQLVAESPQELEERLRAQFDEEAQHIASDTRQEVLHQAAQAEVIETKPPADPPNRKRLWLGLGVSVVIVGVVAVGLGVSASPSTESGGSSPTDVPTASPTSGSPTETPTQASTANNLEIAIRDIVAGISQPSLLQDPESHQSQAIQDLANRSHVNVQNGESVIQHYIMTLFYYATNGNRDWYDSFNMFEGPDLCHWNDANWQGIFCNNKGRINQLNYIGNGLNGTLVEELSALTDLDTLNADDNYLHGPLPSFVNNTRLKEVTLHDNHISGTIPQTLASLPTLRRLDLWGNELWGPIPSFEQNADALDYIDLDYNSWIEGNIETVLSSMPTSLREFSCRHCYLDGTLPATISSLENLEYLSLENCDLVGKIPTETGELRHLMHLNLAQNSFESSLPSELGALTSLLYLDFYDCEMDRTIPTEMGSLTELTTLRLAGNSLTGTIPTQLVEAFSLRELMLSDNELTGAIPSFSNPSLSHFDLDRNHGLTGNITSVLDSFPLTMRMFGCNGCTLRGSLDTIGRLVALDYLDLSESGVTGRFASLSPLSNMVYLLLSSNDLSGPIPEEVSSWGSLKVFHVYDNALTGPLPSLKSPVLNHVDVGDNFLAGNVTEFLLSLPKNTLTAFWCGGNGDLFGSIPTEVGDFSKLNYFGVYANDITGTLPNEMGELEHLYYLSVAHNNMHGTIPDSLVDLSGLGILRLNDNNFNDDLNDPFCIDNHISSFIVDCTKPELVVCDCCTACWSHDLDDFD